MKPKYLEFCGINSFARKAEIDFDQLLSGGIFGIFGDTGSGKTTILDSMIFALYGKIDRIKGAGSEIINYNCDKATVRFDFETETQQGRRVYRVEREIRRKNSAQSLTLSEIDGDRIRPISDGVKNTNAKIQEIVGLSFEDFKKCIALPQGEFAQFVKADRADRLKLIARLFGLEKYGDLLSAKIKEKYSEAKSVFDAKEGELRAYADIEKQSVAAAENEIFALRGQKEALDKEYERFAEEFERFKADHARGKALHECQTRLKELLTQSADIEKLRQLAAVVPKAKEICALQEKQAERSRAASVQERLRDAALKEKAAGEKELAGLRGEAENADFSARTEAVSGKLAALEYIRKDAESLRHKSDEREQRKKEYQALQAKIAQYRTALAAILQKQESAEKSLVALGDADVAQFLTKNFESALVASELSRQEETFRGMRQELHSRFADEGELFVWADSNLSTLEERAADLLAGKKTGDAEKLFEEFRKIQKRRAELADELTNYAAERTRMEGALRESETKQEQIAREGIRLRDEIEATKEKIRNALGADADTDLAAAERSLLKQREDIARQRADSEKRCDAAAERIRANELAAGKAEAARAQLEEDMRRESEALSVLLSEGGYAFADEAKQVVLDFARERDAEKRIADYDSAAISLRANIELLQKEGKVREISEEEYSAQSEKFARLSERKQAVSEALAVCEQQLSDLRRRMEQKQTLEKELAERRQSLDGIAKLLELTRANRFMEFIASEYLSDISAAATVTLLRLTGGRYFIRYEQGFFVGDNLCGGELRGVNTLSGGETFLVSLSLALALSSAIYARSLKPIEFFFLDEGFGTLDEKLIDTVMDSLEKLKNSRFSIGLISHVEELKHRIGTKIIVSGAAENGSSQIKICY